MRHLAFAVALLGLGCASRPAVEPASPSPPSASATGPTPDEAEPKAPERAVPVPPPPPECRRFDVAQATADCSSAPVVLGALAEALESPDPEGKSSALAALEHCEQLEPGVIRALRADLAPRACADVLTEAFSTDGLRPDVAQTLGGLGLAAKLSRLVRTPPALGEPYDKARFMEFFKNTLVPWIAEQARAIFELSGRGARLRGYGQGIVAVEAGLADMRFVELARAIPLPDEMREDAEVRDVYYAALEEALEPRKTRGRDAALVGLRRFAELGVIDDPRIAETRALLSQLFGGRRIDALDGLLLPPIETPKPVSAADRVAASVPTYYLGYLLPEADFTQDGTLGALARRGIPPHVVQRLTASSLSQSATKLFALGLLRLGQTYWRAEDFRRAEQVISPLASGRKADDEARLIAALARVLAAGPKDAAEMMLKGPRYPAGVGGVAPLDEVSRRRGPTAALAAFDAAYLLRLVPPLDGTPDYFRDIERRFRSAGSRLDGEAKARASEFADAAADTAKSIAEGANEAPGAPNP